MGEAERSWWEPGRSFRRLWQYCRCEKIKMSCTGDKTLVLKVANSGSIPGAYIGLMSSARSHSLSIEPGIIPEHHKRRLKALASSLPTKCLSLPPRDKGTNVLQGSQEGNLKKKVLLLLCPPSPWGNAWFGSGLVKSAMNTYCHWHLHPGSPTKHLSSCA